MKNFFKRPTKTKQSNMLIDYTKWLIKMMLFGAMIIGLLIYLLIEYQDSSQESSRNVLFTLNCEIISYDKEKIVNKSGKELAGSKHMIQGVGFESGNLWYVERLHESLYNNESNNFKPEFMEIGEPKWFEPEKGLYKGDYYFSGVLGGNHWFIINRTNLEASVYFVKTKDKYNTPLTYKPLVNLQCSQVSENDYKKASEDLKKSIQKERKI